MIFTCWGLRPTSKSLQSSCAKFYRGNCWLANTQKTAGRRATSYRFPKNFPNPRRTCTVFTPGFGTVSPALEICMYRTSTDHVRSPKKGGPKAAPDVKFMVEVPVGTSRVVNSVPPFNSMYGATCPRVTKIHFSPTGFTPAQKVVLAG